MTALAIQRPTEDADLPRVAGHGLALIAVAAATVVAVMVDHMVHIPNLSLVFVLPVVLSAAAFGWGPALTAALAGTLACNFFLIEPRHTLHVADPSNVWALALLMIVAASVSAVAAESRRRALQAEAAAAQANAVHRLARSLMAETTRASIAEGCARALAQLFSAEAVVLLETDQRLQPVFPAGGARLSSADEEAASWSLASRLPTRAGAYPFEDSRFDFWPVHTPQRQQAVIGVRLDGRDSGRPASPETLVEIVDGYLAVTLDREEYARQLIHDRVHRASEQVKGDLLAAVSHDLRTPLSTILATLQTLRTFGDAHDAETRQALLTSAEQETARLSRMVGNLLDMNRLDAGAVAVQARRARLDDIAAAAVDLATPSLADRRLSMEVRDRTPPVWVDPVLLETALANIIDNAARYGPPGSLVTVRAGVEDGMAWIDILDEGPGFPGAVEPLFERFVRGASGDGRPPGTGLGLSIARGFVEAQGGRVNAANRDDGPGGRVRVWLPLAPEERSAP